MTADMDDFDPPAPRARRPRARGASVLDVQMKPARLGWRGRALALARRYPVELVITLALCGAVAAVAYNALVLQTSRHPAPFFGRGGRIDGPAPLPPVRPSLVVPPAPAPFAAPVPTLVPSRPAARDTIGDLIRAGDAPAPAMTRPIPVRPAGVAPPAAAPSAAPPQAAIRDPIGDLIRIGGGAPLAPPALVGRPETRTVAAGQRALAKLGYGTMKVDGLIGPETRQALERFERERRLPLTGEFSDRTARELSTLSGIQVE
jgi:Putative peptidoglycan binding domain